MGSPTCYVRKCLFYDDFMRPGWPTTISYSSQNNLAPTEPAVVPKSPFIIGDTYRPFFGHAMSNNPNGALAAILSRRNTYGDYINVKLTMYCNPTTDMMSGLALSAATFSENQTYPFIGYVVNADVWPTFTNCRFCYYSYSATPLATLSQYYGARPSGSDWYTIFVKRGVGLGRYTMSYGIDGLFTQSAVDPSERIPNGMVGAATNVQYTRLKRMYAFYDHDTVPFYMYDYSPTKQVRFEMPDFFNDNTGRLMLGNSKPRMFSIKTFIPNMTKMISDPYTGRLHDSYEERIYRMLSNRDMTIIETPVWTASGFIVGVNEMKLNRDEKHGKADIVFQEVNGHWSGSNV